MITIILVVNVFGDFLCVLCVELLVFPHPYFYVIETSMDFVMNCMISDTYIVYSQQLHGHVEQFMNVFVEFSYVLCVELLVLVYPFEFILIYNY